MSKIRQPSKPAELLLSAKKLNLNVQGKHILENVDLELLNHDFITIVGPNGAGKSSLLKVLLNIMKKSSGDIYCKPGLKIGYVPQQFYIPNTLPLKVVDFLNLNSKIKNAQIDDMLKNLDVFSCKHTLMNKLSGGQRQRVLIARALIQKPDLLILDEPAQNLDVKGQIMLYKFLSRLYETKQTSILMVSHDLHMVMSVTTHVICLYGHICCSGSPKTITKDPAFKNLFGEELTSMMSFYNHKHDHNHGGEYE